MLRATPSRFRQQGMSLIEVMVSLVIGLVVVGAVMISYLGSGVSGRQQSAYSQMSEDAQIAFSILGKDISMAGYGRPVNVVVGGTPTIAKAYSGQPLLGCTTGFSNPMATTSTLACGTSATHVISVAFESDSSNSIGTGTIGDYGRDCLGQTLAESTVPGTTMTVTVAYNRYYVANSANGRPELHCAGQTGTPQPLVENVESMKIWYGEAGSASAREIVRYVTANSVTDWNAVISVRVCLLMRSGDKVLASDEVATRAYLDCDQTAQTSGDGYARRAFFSTTTLRNKMAF